MVPRTVSSPSLGVSSDNAAGTPETMALRNRRVIPLAGPHFHIGQRDLHVQLPELAACRSVVFGDITQDILRGDLSGDVGNGPENRRRNRPGKSAGSHLEREVSLVGWRGDKALHVLIN